MSLLHGKNDGTKLSKASQNKYHGKKQSLLSLNLGLFYMAISGRPSTNMGFANFLAICIGLFSINRFSQITVATKMVACVGSKNQPQTNRILLVSFWHLDF